MNQMCWYIEKWEKGIRWQRTYKDFDYSIMMDDSIPFSQDNYNQIKDIYFDYCKTMKELKYEETELKKEHGIEINWNYYHDLYRDKCSHVCSDRELANYAVSLCYEDYPHKSKSFMWKVAESGIIQNIKQVPVKLPCKNSKGTYKYLGKKYSLEDMSID